MYRERLAELKKAKGISTKEWSEQSGVHVDTINAIIHPDNPDKNSPRINTLEDLCKPLGVELWELFFTGTTSLAKMQAEINQLKSDRDTLIAEKAVLEAENARMHCKLDCLKDQLISALTKGR